MASTSQRLERSVEHSAFVSVLSRSIEHSTFLRAGRSAVQGLPDWFETSATNRVLHQLGVAWASAATNRTLTAVGRWARSSYLYNWLTAEPEPDVIVIDLRETYTVGPVIEWLDRSLAVLEPAVRYSRLRSLGERLAETTRAAPIRSTSFVLLAASLIILAGQFLTDPFSPERLLPTLAVTVLAALGTRSTRSWEELRDTRAVQFVIAVLEPPEPIEDTARTDDEAPDTPERPE